MNKSLSLFVFFGLSLLSRQGELQAATYEVGLGQSFVTIASLPVLQPGDLVNIHCGVYNEVRNWTASGAAGNPIVLKGVCTTSRPVIDGTGQDMSGNGSVPRAVWQVQGSFYQIDNLEFKNGRNGSSAAGIRVMNSFITITNCKVTYSDVGILSSTLNADNILVQNTEIAFNGTGLLDGQTHNVYLTKGGAITFAFCYIHDAVSGENFKSRAHYTQLFYNYIADAAESEVEGLDEVDTVGPNSNMTMIGNILVSTPNRTINATKFINFGQDTGGTHNGTLYLINNTLIAGSPSIGFLRSSASNSAIVSINNLYFGSNTIVQPGWTTNISGSNNWMPNTAAVPLGFTGTVAGTLPGFLNASQLDFHLTSTSPARDIGFAAPVYLDGNGVSHSGIPLFEYVQPLSGTPRNGDGKLDAGAYETSGTVTAVTTSPAGLSLVVDSAACTSPCAFQWSPGSTHSIAAANQAGTSGTQYVFSTWSDGGAASHSVTAAAAGGAYTANFTTQYFLTTAASPLAGGAINPPSGWLNAGSLISVGAAPSAGYQFSGFSGGLSGSGTPQSLTLNAPATVTANFSVAGSGGSYTAGLIGYWSFDESSGGIAHDTSGSGNTGAVDGATWTTGKINSGLSFNGTNAVVTPNIALAATFSVSAWVNPTAQGVYLRIAETHYGAGFYLGTNASGTRYKFIVNGSTGSTGSCGLAYGCADGGTVTSGWHLVTATFDGTTGKLYVDNALVASDTFTAPSNTNLPLNIGRLYYAGGGYGWNGAIDEVRLYNRALTAAEVNAIFN